MKIFSIGHSTRSLEDFMRLLKEARVNCLVDVRRYPYSPRQPHFNIACLPKSLEKHGIHYLHMEALGGRRAGRQDGQPSRHSLWREKGFRHYADYAETEEFQRALSTLLKMADTHQVVIMCAEANWQQCHRRIITDYILAAGVKVEHIMTGKIEPAGMTEGATVGADHTLLYNDMPLFRRVR